MMERTEKNLGKAARSKPAHGKNRRAAQPEPAADFRSLVPAGVPLFSRWRSAYSYLFLSVATILALLPFSGKAFHVDDTLFLFAAKQIVKHPLDPYGFELVWNKSVERMSDVTENPPLACYFAALVGSVAGWSERALHVAFLLPALGLILGTYRLGRRCTRFPLIAALAVFLTPGMLVSATSVMCDTMMLALWVWAVILWVEGLQPFKPSYLIGSVLLIAASALTKYFGMALIPLLLAYSVVRFRRIGWWAAYFLIPILLVAGYEIWTGRLYGHGLIAGAAEFAATQREFQQRPTLTHVLVSLSFTGGCALSALTLMPLLWSWKKILAGALFSGLAAASLIFGWLDYGARVGGDLAAESILHHSGLLTFQLALCILSGISILAMAIADLWFQRGNAESWLLGLWVMGTWIFAGFVNWTVNARSVLPLIPAAGILMLRRLDNVPALFRPRTTLALAGSGLALAGILSFSIAAHDAAWANSAREAANWVYEKTRGERGAKYFAGHWGFQYYMQGLGFTPADEENTPFAPGDILIVPSNNTEVIDPPADFQFIELGYRDLLDGKLATTMNANLGAGFYSEYWGPLPFAFGPMPADRYGVFRLIPKQDQ